MILPLLAALVAQGAQSAPAPPNALTAAERAAGWRLLFDGRTLRGWRGLGYDSVPTAHWVVVDGTIKKIASGDVPKLPDGQPLHGGDLMTVDTFGDFELTWDSSIRSWTMTGTRTASWRRIAPVPCTTSSRRAGRRTSVRWANGTSPGSSSGATTASTG